MERPADIIKRLRLDRGYTQADCSRLSEGRVPKATWCRVESGATADPHPNTKLGIAFALGVAVSDIWAPTATRRRVGGTQWRTRALAEAQRVDREGASEERQAYGARMRKVLVIVDPSARSPDEDPRFAELWRVVTSLVEDENTPTFAVTYDGAGESLIDYFTPPAKERVIAARRRRVKVQKTRVAAHAAATTGDQPVSRRPRKRERRDTRRSSSRGSPDGDPDEPEPALGRIQAQAGAVK